MTLQQNLLYAFLPAALGALAGVALLLLARRGTKLPADAEPRFLILLSLPAVSVVLALVGALVTAEASDAARVPLLVLGGAALVQGAGQGVLGAARVRELPDPAKLPRTLMTLAVLEVPTVLALVWVLQHAPPA